MKFPSTITEFYVCERDETGNPCYYGFMNAFGNWYIMEETDRSIYRYSSGVSNFVTNWANRASLTYDYPYQG